MEFMGKKLEDIIVTLHMKMEQVWNAECILILRLITKSILRYFR